MILLARSVLEDLVIRHINTTLYVMMSRIIPTPLIPNYMEKLEVIFCVRGVISPLLANIFLHELDRRFYGAQGPAQAIKARLVRYADDFVVLAYAPSARLRGYVDKVLQHLGLGLNRDKTRIVDLRRPGESLDFLGFTFRYDANRFGPGRYLHIVPSAKAMKRVRERLRHLTARQVNRPLNEVIGQVNRFLRGWSNYFSFGYPCMACRKVNWYVQQRLRCFLRTRSQRRGQPLPGPTRYQALRAQGLVYLCTKSHQLPANAWG